MMLINFLITLKVLNKKTPAAGFEPTYPCGNQGTRL